MRNNNFAERLETSIDGKAQANKIETHNEKIIYTLQRKFCRPRRSNERQTPTPFVNIFVAYIFFASGRPRRCADALPSQHIFALFHLSVGILSLTLSSSITFWPPEKAVAFCRGCLIVVIEANALRVHFYLQHCNVPNKHAKRAQ